MEDPDTRDNQIVQLIVKNQPALQAYVMSLMPGQVDVEDVIQETCSLIWQKRDEFKVGTSFKAWMFSIAKFKVLSCWRDAKRRKEWVVPEETLTSLMEEAPEELLQGNERQRKFMRLCIRALRTEDRSLILRRYLKETGIKELAEEDGRTSDSVRVSLHRIRRSLRECIRRKTQQVEALS